MRTSCVEHFSKGQKCLNHPVDFCEKKGNDLVAISQVSRNFKKAVLLDVRDFGSNTCLKKPAIA